MSARDERVTRILNDLTSLIVDHAGMTAIEQYRPTLKRIREALDEELHLAAFDND